MYSSFARVLDYGASAGSLLVLTDRERADSAFLLYHFMAAGVASPERGLVLLSALGQSREHEAIMRRLGHNLSAAGGRYFALDIGAADLGGDCVAQQLDALLREVSGRIAAAGSRVCNWTVVVDALPPLLYADACEPLDAVRLVGALRDAVGENTGNIIVTVSADAEGAANAHSPAARPELAALNALRHLADIVLDVRPLRTGVASDKHGQLTVSPGGSYRAQDAARLAVSFGTFNYRVLDKTAEFLAKAS